MQYRLLNRLAQRYLVRGATPLPVVDVPGVDPASSADWLLVEADVRGTYHLIAASDRRRVLLFDAGRLEFDEIPLTSSGCWSLLPVGDGSEYQFVASATDPAIALCADLGEHSDKAPLDLVMRPSREREAMWLIGQDCVADARSIHLRYQAPTGLTLFYNEVYPEQTPPGTYFCTSGFGADARTSSPSGYAGIQRLIDRSWLAIFSVWHRMADAGRPVPGQLATVVAAHPDAHTAAFSGEGSGSSIRLSVDRRGAPDERVRVCVVGEAGGSDTTLTCYFSFGDAPWWTLGSIVRAETGGELMGRPYAFIEDFARTGNAAGVAAIDRSPYRPRSARFVNPWFAGAAKELTPVPGAEVTMYGPHPLENLAAETTSGNEFGVWLATGTPTAEHDPPDGATFSDPEPGRRVLPDLSGVPYR